MLAGAGRLTPLLRADGLRKSFRLATGRLLAVDGVDLELHRGETLAIVGESGCGKSTLGRLLLRLQEPDAGRLALEGADIRGLEGGALRAIRRRMQIIFQDPFSSLDPRQTVRELLTRPIRLHGLARPMRLHGLARPMRLHGLDRPMRLHGLADAEARAIALMERVGLAPAQLALYPHEFSGGQRQRVAIARALSVEPDLIVCDEPVSALDVSVQAQIVNLLADLQRDTGVALLFISHDLAVVRQIAHRVGVMYAGRIVETGPVGALFDAPAHPYTRALLAAAPRIGQRAAAVPIDGEPPDMTDPPPGCRFASRCPDVQAVCRGGEAPALRDLGGGHGSACLFADRLPPWPDMPGEISPEPLRGRIAAYRRARDQPCG